MLAERPPPPSRALAPRRRAPRLAWALVLLAAACGRDLTVNVRTGDRPPDPDEHTQPTPTPTPTPSMAVSQPLVAAGVAVDRFEIVLRDLRLQASPTLDGAPNGNDESISPATVLVDLSGAHLDPGAMTEVVGSRSVRWASFYQTVITLAPVAQEDVALNASLAPLLGRTFVITGRMAGGAPFTFESSVSTVLVRPATFRMGSNHNNVTINIAPNLWFLGADGEPLDPRDPASRATIEANVLKSIDGYMDDNRDGNPDSLG